MRVAALYDVHGNLPALEAVLADERLAAADVVVSGGDLAVGPLPGECLELLEALGERARFLAGNGERELLDPPAEGPLAEVVRWSRGRLAGGQLERVAAWPATVEVEHPRLGRLLFCHGTPRSDTTILTRVTPEPDVAAELAGVDASVVVCGHTHVQYERGVGGVRLVNAGSVGMPYEGSPDARWALLGPDGVELVSTPYDSSAGLARLAATGFPRLDDWFGAVARGEVSAEEATATFERRRGA